MPRMPIPPEPGLSQTIKINHDPHQWTIVDPAQLKRTRLAGAREPEKITVVCATCGRAIDYVPVSDIDKALKEEKERLDRLAHGTTPWITRNWMTRCALLLCGRKLNKQSVLLEEKLRLPQ